MAHVVWPFEHALLAISIKGSLIRYVDGSSGFENTRVNTDVAE